MPVVRKALKAVPGPGLRVQKEPSQPGPNTLFAVRNSGTERTAEPLPQRVARVGKERVGSSEVEAETYVLQAWRLA